MTSEQDFPPAPGDDEGFQVIRFGDVHEPSVAARRREPDAPQPVRHAEVAGGANGLDRVRMLEAIDGLRAMGRAIESLDVVRAVCDRPQYVLERKSYERGMGEPAGQWCMRSHHMARDFVATFADPGDGSVRFVLVTVEIEEQRRAA